MGDVLTRSQIEAQFDGEWVLVGDVETSQTLEVQRGRVLYHSKDRDEVWRQAIALKPARSAVFYNGTRTIPPDTAYLLGPTLARPNMELI